MKLIPALLIVGMLAVSGWAEGGQVCDYWTSEPYSAELVKKAEAGDAVAQFDLGLCYSSGTGVAKNKKEALKWITKSAEQGYSFAQSDLGTCYTLGLGVAKDEKEALKWYKKVAEQKATPTTPAQSFKGTYEQNYLGNYYSFTKDYKEAVKWYTKAAEQGDTWAQNNLGSLYYKGEGVTQDYKEAVKWYTKSAEQGNAEAQRILAVCYEKGTGVAKDEKEALKWSEKAKAENKRRRVVMRDEETIDDSTPAMAIASLTDPQKLANLQGERASNSRFQKCLYWLATARAKGESPSDIMASANLKNGEQVTSYGTLLSSSLTANLAEADKLGLFSPEGLDELRRGKSAMITKGEYAGQEATADYRIPRSVCPELDNQIFNLRLLPSKLNSSKGDKVEMEQVEYAEELHRNGLLSQGGLDAVDFAYNPPPSPLPQEELVSQEERDKAEEKNQTRMNEEAKQLKLEEVRAERKGTEAVYEVLVSRLRKLGKEANESKATKDVLTFEDKLSSALELWERVFEENWNKNHPRQGAEYDFIKRPAFERQKNEELARLESFLDESLRGKKSSTTH